MKNFYISSNDQRRHAGLDQANFHNSWFEENQYQFIDRDEDISNILSIIASRDHVHLDIGPGKKRESELLRIMLDANYGNVSITLHDLEFLIDILFVKTGWWKTAARVYFRFIGRYKLANNHLKKIKSIYVSTIAQQNYLRSVLKLNNVHFRSLIDLKPIK